MIYTLIKLLLSFEFDYELMTSLIDKTKWYINQTFYITGYLLSPYSGCMWDGMGAYRANEIWNSPSKRYEKRDVWFLEHAVTYYIAYRYICIIQFAETSNDQQLVGKDRLWSTERQYVQVHLLLIALMPIPEPNFPSSWK